MTGVESDSGLPIALLAWLCIGGALVVVEIFTVGFFFMFFAIGAIITALVTLALPDVTMTGQLIIFLVSSFVLVLFGRPVAKRWFKVQDEPLKKSNVDALKGQEVIVLDTVRKHQGRVKIVHTGEVWSACLDHSHEGVEEILEGTEAVVYGVDAAKLLIRPKS